MQRFAQCTEIWKKFQNSVIQTSRNHNDEIAEESQSWTFKVITTIRRNYSERYFLQNWARILIWIIIDLIKNYRHIIKKRTIRIISHLNIFAFIFCVDLLTPESLWRHKGVAMHVTYKTTKPCIDFLRCMIRHPPLRNFACKFRLLNVSKPNNSCHNRISGATRIRQCTRRYAPRALTDPRGPFVPPISQCTTHHA